MLPVATRIIVIPSSINSNFSLSMMGDKNALNTIVKQDVDEMRIIFPKANAKAFKI